MKFFTIMPSPRRVHWPELSTARAPFRTGCRLVWSCLLLTLAVAIHAAPPAADRSPARPTFEVKAYQIEGNTVLPVEVIDAIFAGHVGPKLTAVEVNTVVATFQQAYRERGYGTARVEQ